MVLMGGYKPLYIKGNETGLVQDRVNFILPDDAYPVLENAYVWRERLIRKKGASQIGRLQRTLTDEPLINTDASPWSFNIYDDLATPITGEPNAAIVPGTVVITIAAGPIVFTDQGDGTLTSPTPGNSGTINYATGDVVLTHTAGIGVAVTITFSYYPSLPVMGICSEERNAINVERPVYFDTKYAYIKTSLGFTEFLPGTTWTGDDDDFFWSTNYWVGDSNLKIFWVTNFSGTAGDPIRYTNGAGGSNWVDFTPQITSPTGTNEQLYQCLAMLPFRGRMFVFNTWEGQSLAGSVNYRQRIRWAAIGNPFTVASPIVTTVSADAWRDDIIGKGGFLDIPTAEDIVSVGFVRDNLVIYCETSTWQLRYTGRSIQPVQIEKVNTELGAESTFSAIQFDTTLVGVGDKGIVQCDSFKSERIDIKIPDLVFLFNNDTDAQKRVYGIRNFTQRLAYWTYPYKPVEREGFYFPNRRLVYNYENDSWAIFVDSFTVFGEYQEATGKQWKDFPPPDSNNQWQACNFPWLGKQPLVPLLAAGNQQGYVMLLDQENTNAPSLQINGITGNVTTPTRINSVNHNLEEGQIITITGILSGTDFDDLNGNHFYVNVIDPDNFDLYVYNTVNKQFTTPQVNPAGSYIGGGEIAVRDNFRIVSKKFNMLDQGQNIQMGYLDALFNTTADGAVTLLVYLDYNDDSPVNTLPDNISAPSNQPDEFFNTVVPTTEAARRNSSKTWQRVFCPVRGAFITLEWTLSNAQMIGNEQESDVEIQAQILWVRTAGTQLPIGV
jgi:hypothetical protein